MNQPYDFPICERPLPEWIGQPANTWSNLGMFGAGAFLIARGLRDKCDSDIALGAAIIVMGVFSALAHATSAPLFVFLDVTSIFLLLSLLSALSFTRRRKINRHNIVFGCVFAAAVVLQLVSGRDQILALILFAVFLISSEVLFLRRRPAGVRVDSLFWGLGLQAVAAVCLALDYTRTACSPDNHVFQFHALWHLLSGLAMFSIATYMRQFGLRIFPVRSLSR